MSLEQRVGQTMGHAGVAVSGVYTINLRLSISDLVNIYFAPTVQ